MNNIFRTTSIFCQMSLVLLAMRENNDKKTFDINKSEIEETRSYFDHQKLIHQVNNQDCGTPYSSEYLIGEQKRLMADFNKLKVIKPDK